MESIRFSDLGDNPRSAMQEKRWLMLTAEELPHATAWTAYAPGALGVDIFLALCPSRWRYRYAAAVRPPFIEVLSLRPSASALYTGVSSYTWSADSPLAAPVE